MSYVLFVWEAPVPSTLREADAIQARLAGQRGSGNPKFEQLVEAVLRRFPCITTLPEDSDEGVWTDGPLTGRTDHPVLALGVRAERADEVVPVLAEEAGKLGLVVYDMQAPRAVLPDGKVLGQPLPASIPASKGAVEPTSGAEVAAVVLDALRTSLEQHGFNYRTAEKAFVRQCEGFAQKLSVITEGCPGDWAFKLYANVYVTRGAELLKEALGYEPDCYRCVSRVDKFAAFRATAFDYPAGGWFSAGTALELEAAAGAEADFVRLVLVPCLDECRTFAGLDRYLNTLPLEDCAFEGDPEYFTNLLVAHLAHSSRRAKLERYVLENAPAGYHANFRKFGAYLDELPSPQL